MEDFLDRLLNVITDTNPAYNGDVRLPSERSLSESLEMNRTTLREKMAILEAMGFIKRAQGSGTHLTMPHSQILQLTFNMALKMNYTNIEQLESAREIIEVGVAKSAAINATSQDIKAIEYFLNRLLATTDAEYGHELDHAFHMALGTSSHNPVLIIILDSFSASLRKVLQERRHKVSQIPHGLDKTNATHIAIFEAVKDHNPERAKKAMEQHFTIWSSVTANKA